MGGWKYMSFSFLFISDTDSSLEYLISDIGRRNYFFSRKLRKDAKEAEKTLYRNGQKKIASGTIGVVSGVFGVLGTIGVILAPVTFGASLSLSAVSVSVSSACVIASTALAITGVSISLSEEKDRTNEFLRNQKEMIETVQNKSQNLVKLLLGKPSNICIVYIKECP